MCPFTLTPPHVIPHLIPHLNMNFPPNFPPCNYFGGFGFGPPPPPKKVPRTPPPPAPPTSPPPAPKKPSFDPNLWMMQETDGEETETDEEFGLYADDDFPASPPASPLAPKGKAKHQWPRTGEEEISEASTPASPSIPRRLREFLPLRVRTAPPPETEREKRLKRRRLQQGK